MRRILFPCFFFILVLICQTRAYLLVDDECSSDRLSCPDNSSCRPLSCRGYRCACNAGFMPSENNTKCIQGAALGEKCGSIYPPCLNANAVCTKGLISLSPPNCQCQKGFVNADNRECLIETVDKRFGESCEKKCGPTLSCTLAFCQCRPGYRQRTTLEIQADPSYQYDCIQNEFSLTKCKGVEVDFYAIDPKSVFQGGSKTTLDLNITESSLILNTSTDATVYQNDNQTFLNPENQSVTITKPTSSETFPSRTMSPKVVSLIIQPVPTMGPKVGLGLTTELRDQNTTFEHNETTTAAGSKGSTQDGNFESLPTVVAINRDTTVSTPQKSFSVSHQTSNPNRSDSLKTLKPLHPTESQSVSTHSLFQHSTQQLHLTNSTAVSTLAQPSNETSSPQYPDVRLQTTIPTPWRLSSANTLGTSTGSNNPENKHGLTTTTTVLATETSTISDVVTGSRDNNNNNSSEISNNNNNNNNNNNLNNNNSSSSSSTEKGKKAIAMTEAPATKSVGSSRPNSENRISTNAIVIPSVLVIVLAIVIVSVIGVVACKKRRSQLSLSTPIQINPYKLPRPSMMSQALTSAPCPPSSANYPTYHYVNHAFENERL